MPGPTNDVAQLIMQLMSRGRSGGLPMQASPELTQYLAHAQAGSAPPQLRGMPSAEVLPGPGSAMAELRDPNFLNDPVGDYATVQSTMPPELMGGQLPNNARTQAVQDELRSAGIDPTDMLTDRPPPNTFRHAGGNGTEDNLFIWYMNAKGQRVRLDGPFTNDIEAARALRELRSSGLDPNAQVEIAPDFDPSR